MAEIVLNQTEHRKLNVELSPGADYTYNELNPDVISYDKATQIVTASADNTSQDAKIEFTPSKNGNEGDKVILRTKVRELLGTTLALSESNLTIEANQEIIVNVITEANDFSVSSDNANVSVSKIDKKSFRIQTQTVGNSNITVTARVSGKKESKVTLPVVVEAETTKVSIVPEAGEYLMYVGETRKFQFKHNNPGGTINANVTSGNSVSVVYNTADDTLDVTCNNTNGRTQVVVDTAIQGQASASVELFITPIADEPFLNLSEDGVFFTNANASSKTITLEQNLPNLELRNLNTNVSNVSIDQQLTTSTITPTGKGVSNIVFESFPGKGGIQKNFKVIVDEPCITFGGKLYPTFEVFNGGDFLLSTAELQGGAYDFVLEPQEFYDVSNDTMLFKNMTIDSYYRVKVTPKIAGSEIVENSSYITFKCVTPQETELTLSSETIQVELDNYIDIEVTTPGEYVVNSSNNDKFWVSRTSTGVRINASELGTGSFSITAREGRKLPITKTISVEVISQRAKPTLTINPSPLTIIANSREALTISLNDADRYEYSTQDSNIVDFDEVTSEIVSYGVVNSSVYIDFIPYRGNIAGDAVRLQVEVIQSLGKTQLEVTPDSATIWEGNSTQFNVTTDAASYDVITLDNLLSVTKEANSFTVQSTRGNAGVSQVLVTAKRDKYDEASQLINVTIEEHSRISVTPNELRPVLTIGTNKEYRVMYNTNQPSVYRTSANINVAFWRISEGVMGLRVQPLKVGSGNVVIQGTKAGSTQTSVTIVCQVKAN